MTDWTASQNPPADARTVPPVPPVPVAPPAPVAAPQTWSHSVGRGASESRTAAQVVALILLMHVAALAELYVEHVALALAQWTFRSASHSVTFGPNCARNAASLFAAGTHAKSLVHTAAFAS